MSQPLNGVFGLLGLVILFIGGILVVVSVGTGGSAAFHGSYSDMQPQPQQFFTPPANAFHNLPAYQVRCTLKFKKMCTVIFRYLSKCSLSFFVNIEVQNNKNELYDSLPFFAHLLTSTGVLAL